MRTMIERLKMEVFNLCEIVFIIMSPTFTGIGRNDPSSESARVGSSSKKDRTTKSSKFRGRITITPIHFQRYKKTGNPRRGFLIKKLQWILLSILNAESKRVIYWWRKEYMMLCRRNISRH
ncbi:unnamed protein product [Lactuca virosa]|uniref:Uncharacterized protein n=1 Tax=Lactuca virosa TaxID=75947 RepID=A0AAU9MB54_9ASTR|nr:unnamed protein product [Lactuca virosa]